MRRSASGIDGYRPIPNLTVDHRVESHSMSKKPLNIGLVGYGFMGRTHSNGYKRVNDFFDLEYRPVLKAVCGRSEEAAKAFAEKWGYESVETDWRKLVARKDIDAIDICTPNNTHAEIAIAAAEAGKMILCEKPLSMDLVEGQKMVDAIEKAGVPNTVWYNYRRVPGRHPGQAVHRRGPARPDLPLPGQLPPGLDDLRRPAPGRDRASGGSTPRRPARASPATCSPTASTPRSGSTARSPRSPP